MAYWGWNAKAIMLSLSKWCTLLEFYTLIDEVLTPKSGSTFDLNSFQKCLLSLHRKCEFDEHSRFPDDVYVCLGELNIQKKLVKLNENLPSAINYDVVFEIKNELRGGRCVFDRNRFERECVLTWLED